MPLSAANTRTALAALPLQVEAVPIQLKFDGVTFNPDDLFKILSFMGIPRFKTQVPSRGAYSVEFDANHQILLNPGGETADLTGSWSANAGGAVAQATAGQLIGTGAVQHTAAAVAFEGATAAISNLPIPVRLKSPKVMAVVWVKALDGVDTVTIQLEERTLAGTVATTTTTQALNTSTFTPVVLTRQFGATGAAARLSVIHDGVDGAANGRRILLDACALGVIDQAADAQLSNATLNPDQTSRPTIIQLDVALAQGQTLSFVDFYDVLNELYATVATDKDSVGKNGNLSLTIR